MRVQDKVTLITGAGTGIGKETAHLFAKEGAKLILTDVNVEGVKETEKEVNELGAEAISIKHDVSKEADWKEVVKRALTNLEPLMSCSTTQGYILSSQSRKLN